MSDAQRMTKQEVHAFGVEIVVDQLRKEGYEIDSVNTDLGVDLQVVGRRDNHLVFIAVRTACYPEKGQLEESGHFQMIEYAQKHGAIPYFASVGIANADAKTEAEMGVPIRGAGFHVAYEGMVVIARSDRIRIWEEENIRNVTEQDIEKSDKSAAKLMLVLGPPPDGWQKELFDKYQESRRSGKARFSGDWESFEKEVVEKLFAHVGDAPSIIEELFSRILDSPIKITDYFFSMGVSRRLWVANTTIARSNVLCGQRSHMTWPPPKEVNDAVATSLGYILKRSWVGAFSLHA